MCRTHIPNHDGKVYCPKCSIYIENWDKYKVHTRKHKLDSIDAGESPQLNGICKKCGINIQDEIEMRKHFRTHFL